MLIEIFGPGCQRCKQLMKNAEEAVKESGVDAHFEKVQDFKKIMTRGVMMTPALAIDGIVVSMGKILTPEEIKKEIANQGY